MALIVVLFLTLLIVSFAMLAVATRPSKLQKRLSQRIEQVCTSSIVDVEVEQASNLLKAIKPNRYPLLTKLLAGMGVEQRLDLLLVQAASQSTAAEVFLKCICCAAGGGLLVAFFDLPWFASAAAATESASAQSKRTIFIK